MTKYQAVLISDDRLLTFGVKYQASHLNSEVTSLDSPLFGATIGSHSKCKICNQSVDRCTSHGGVIEIPIPIINTVKETTCKQLLECICPCCSHLLVPDTELAKIRMMKRDLRFNAVRAFVKQRTANLVGQRITCPHCSRAITGPITFVKEEQYSFCPYPRIMDPVSNSLKYAHPMYVRDILQNYVQLEEIGLTDTCHPRNFMTSLIYIIPAKMRTKSLINGEEAASELTTYYTAILKEVIPHLSDVVAYCTNNAPEDQRVVIHDAKLADYIQWYARLYAYVGLILNPGSENISKQMLKCIGKKTVETGYDANNSMIRKFKGKGKSIFNKGILGFIHDVSSRVVLGPSLDGDMDELTIPLTMANALITMYPVYKENLAFCKTLIMKMADPKVRSNIYLPKVIGIQDEYGQFTRLKRDNVGLLVTKLHPRCKLALSLFDKDFVIQSRHPVIREEGMTSFQVNKEETTVVSIPVSVGPIKQADYDGDEIQVYCMSGHYTDIESLLLHSVYTQVMCASDRVMAFYFDSDHDDLAGVRRIKDTVIPYYRHRRINPTNVLELIQKSLPKGITYSNSSLVIRNGVIDKKLCNFDNPPFFKYVASTYGADFTSRLIDELSQIGYDLNRKEGASMGYEIRFWGTDKEWKQLNEMKTNASKEASAIIRMKGRATQEAVMAFSATLGTAKGILQESAKGQNFDKNGYMSRINEYCTFIYARNWVQIDGEPIQPTLADGTRCNFGGYRYSFDPVDYGMLKEGSAYDVNPYSEFYIMADEWGSIYTRTTGVAVQGYMTNQLNVMFERAYADYNGCIVDGKTLIATQYGSAGIDPRADVKLALPDIDVSPADFAKAHSDKELIKLHDELYAVREHYRMNSAFLTVALENAFVTGFDFSQIFNLAKKGSTPQKVADAFIQDMYDVFIPESLQDNVIQMKESLKSHEYYFRSQMETYEMTVELAEQICSSIRRMLVQAGDPIGVKAGLTCSAPLTQAALSSIHKAASGGASVDRVDRPTAMEAFASYLTEGRSMKEKYQKTDTKVSKKKVVTIALVDDSKESCEAFAIEQETIVYTDIWSKNVLHGSKRIPDQAKALYGTVLEGHIFAPFYVESTWEMVTVSGYGCLASNIANALIANYPIIKCVLPIHIESKTQLKALIYFNETTTLIEIESALLAWADPNDPRNIIHGGLLKNCFVAELARAPGHYVIEANEAFVKAPSLEVLLYDERIDAPRCRVNDSTETLMTFGVFEGEARHYEQLVYTAQMLGDTKGIAPRNYALLAAVQTVDGEMKYASSLSMMKSRQGEFLKRCKFERANEFIDEHLTRGEPEELHEFTSAYTFNDIPTLGSGVSNYVWYSKEAPAP